MDPKRATRAIFSNRKQAPDRRGRWRHLTRRPSHFLRYLGHHLFGITLLGTYPLIGRSGR
jgi:hypothetical protein